ncbi:plasmid mobilization protein [Anaerotruncus colihominis]|uniref:plasmid mobilization protein n=1 Tax=Anaerotruncus colihominis TaxID=169435 RepID=UPI0035149A78
MKGGHNKKSVRTEFVMSEQDAELVRERMAKLGITNLSAYLRKMAVDGYIIHLDMSDIQEMIRLLRICSNNLNQYARRANETGSIYASDVDDLRTRLDSLWDGMDKLLRGFANIS